MDYDPKVVCFSCNFGWGYLSDTAAVDAQVKHWVRVPCTGKIDPIYILQAFKKGADGILVLGCPMGNCHFQDGNYRTEKRIYLLQSVLEAYGIEPERVDITLSSDADGRRIPQLVHDMAVRLAKMGPPKQV
jgi:F420-non-reducing hydrogenase iron-sulfur subunit